MTADSEENQMLNFRTSVLMNFLISVLLPCLVDNVGGRKLYRLIFFNATGIKR